MRKVGVIGCGMVGSATAFALMQSGLFTEMVMVDVDEARAEGEALDISHGMPFAEPMRIYAGDYGDLVDASIIIVAAGVGQKAGETRLELVGRNVEVLRAVIPEVARCGCRGLLLMVSNPVDILTHVAIKLSGWSCDRVIGSGTVLDTARLKYQLGHHLGIDPRNLHAFILGEHGDGEIAAWSSADVSGVPLDAFCEMRGFFEHEKTMDEMARLVRNSAYEIIEKKKVTNYGIAMSVRRICEAVVRDEKSILPVSSMMRGEYGLDGVVLSMPAIVGADGVEKIVPVSLDDRELAALKASAAMLKHTMAHLAL